MEQLTFTISRLWDGTEDTSAGSDVVINFRGTFHRKQTFQLLLDTIYRSR